MEAKPWAWLINSQARPPDETEELLEEDKDEDVGEAEDAGDEITLLELEEDCATLDAEDGVDEPPDPPQATSKLLRVNNSASLDFFIRLNLVYEFRFYCRVQKTSLFLLSVFQVSLPDNGQRFWSRKSVTRITLALVRNDYGCGFQPAPSS